MFVWVNPWCHKWICLTTIMKKKQLVVPSSVVTMTVSWYQGHFNANSCHWGRGYKHSHGQPLLPLLFVSLLRFSLHTTISLLPYKKSTWPFLNIKKAPPELTRQIIFLLKSWGRYRAKWNSLHITACGFRYQYCGGSWNYGDLKANYCTDQNNDIVMKQRLIKEKRVTLSYMLKLCCLLPVPDQSESFRHFCPYKESKLSPSMGFFRELRVRKKTVRNSLLQSNILN